MHGIKHKNRWNVFFVREICGQRMAVVAIRGSDPLSQKYIFMDGLSALFGKFTALVLVDKNGNPCKGSRPFLCYDNI